MKTLTAFIFFLISTMTLSAAQDKPYILVSVAPHKFFVEKIAENTVEVGVMVPAGASSHTFEPTPKQMIAAGKAVIWFTIGEGFEARASKALLSHNPAMKLVDLRKNVALIYEQHCSHASHSHDEHCADPHIWLSARQAKIQARTIAEALIAQYPANRELYQKRLSIFEDELDALDVEITSILQPLEQRTILVSHPAYAYFCRDYQLNQLSVEFEGKDPTSQQLTRLLTQARQAGIHKVFVQMQYSSKGARLVAEELGVPVVNLDPYAESYMKTMRVIAHAFAES
jgi:zinc transport system substrate-binding protein